MDKLKKWIVKKRIELSEHWKRVEWRYMCNCIIREQDEAFLVAYVPFNIYRSIDNGKMVSIISGRPRYEWKFYDSVDDVGAFKQNELMEQVDWVYGGEEYNLSSKEYDNLY